MKAPRLSACVILLAVITARLAAAPEQQRLARLEMVADLWGRLYLFHPRIVSMNLDWDTVLVEAIPKIENAATSDDLIDALNRSLFAPLDDPLTRAGRRAPVSSKATARPISARRLSLNVGYLDASDPSGYGEDPASRTEQLIRELGPVEALVVDLRFSSSTLANLDWLRLFLDTAETTGGRVARQHDGWREDNSPYTYRQRWIVDPGPTLQPFGGGRPVRIPAAFVVNRASYETAASVLDLLQSREKAVVVFEDRGSVMPFAEQYPEDVDVRLNTAALLSKSGNLGVWPDHTASTPIVETELSALVESLLTDRKTRKSAPRHPFSFEMTFAPAAPVSAEAPSRERRLLGLFKMWTVISYLDPHLQNASLDWSGVLHDWIPRVEGAETLADYYSVLGRLAAKLNDSHAQVSHPSLTARTIVPLRIRVIEGKPIVVALIDGPPGPPSSVRIGDELIAVDGKRLETSLAENEPLISASTPGALRRELIFPVLNGRGKDALDVVVQGETGVRTVTLTPVPFRVRAEAWATPGSTPYKTIVDNIGYIDLRVLTEHQMRPALTALLATQGLILDMRGYPRFPVWDLLIPHFIEEAIPRNRAEHLVRTGGQARPTAAMRELSGTIQPDPILRYLKPIVVLVDERTVSAAEHFCINLKGAKRATFVGGTTGGADGDVARISLPGGGSMTFTGSVIRFADGRRFQNVGIVPDFKVEPTIQGVRQGRDEVLEKGIEVLRSLR